MPNDYRTTPGWSDGVSYYVYSNLRSVQDKTPAHVCYFDTLPEAMAVYRYLGVAHPEWATALGGSIHGKSEVDLFQRRNGVTTLITDYKNLELWKDNPEVRETLETAITSLGVEWQADHELIDKCSILIPQEHDEPPLERYLEDKVLRPTNPNNVLTSIQEVFCGEGWMSLDELRERTKSLGYKSDYPKVSRLNVAYRVPERQLTGYVDIAPSDFRHMKATYLESSKEKSVEDLAKQAKNRAAEKNAAREATSKPPRTPQDLER